MDSPAKKRARSGKEKDYGGVEKESRKANFLKKIFNGDQATISASMVKRKPTLMKKAMELQTLCGIDVSIVCFDPKGGVDIWPQDESEVKKRCSSYLGLDEKAKKELTCCQYLEHKKKKILKKRNKKKGKDIDLLISGLSNWIEGLSGDELRDSVVGLEAKVKSFKERIELLQIRQQQQHGEVKEEMDKKDFFTGLSDIQVLEGLGPTPTGYYMNNGVHGFLEYPIGYDNYNYNCMVNEHMIGESSNNHYFMASTSTSNQTSPTMSSSIYDAMPISQWSSNFGGYSSTDNYFF